MASSSSSRPSYDDEDGDNDEIGRGPIRIQDHLDDLHGIPLADVRNFCIIAHVVSTLTAVLFFVLASHATHVRATILAEHLTMMNIQDHGKSSLASRILEYTGNLGKEKQSIAWRGGLGDKENDDGRDDDGDGDGDGVGTTTTTTTMVARDDAVGGGGDDDGKEEIFVLDTLAVERERGITVKGEWAGGRPFSLHR